jgi:hypothetical protein
MAQSIRTQNYPVFEKGTFQSHPDLFNRFEQNAPDHLQSKYERLWQSLPRYEETITWPLVSGPGFCGATHPGADTVFVDIMVGINSYVYNSDCLYINPARRIFAISDPPGITTGSRRLFERLDGYLRTASDDLDAYFNRLNRETRPEEGATLSLVHVPEDRPGIAQVIIAGDTFLLHGNASRGTIRIIRGCQDFIGTPYATFESQEIRCEPGDFFLIASDGILSMVHADPLRKLENALRPYINGDPEDMVRRILVDCNAYYRETIFDRTFSRFGGNDNVSLLLVAPEKLEESTSAASVILGGYIEERG